MQGYSLQAWVYLQLLRLKKFEKEKKLNVSTNKNLSREHELTLSDFSTQNSFIRDFCKKVILFPKGFYLF